MAVTATQIYSEIAYTLIESPTDGSTNPTSGLWTTSAIMARVNYRCLEFNKRTGVYVKNAISQATTNAVRDISIPTDCIDLLQVNYRTTSTSTSGTIPKGSVYEADLFISNEITSAPTPTIYTIEDSNILSISLIPPPDSSSNSCVYTYIAQPPTLPSPPDSTPLVIPDDMTPFIKYGALADLFGKSGETYDPQRQEICLSLYELGVDMARHWVSGGQS